MERTNFKRANLITSGDWHLREDTPVCRTDDFEKAQWDKVDFVSDLQRKHNCPVVHSGDLFKHWKPSPYLLSKTMEHLPEQFCTIYGNHDLPQHNFELRDKSGIFALEKAEKLTVLKGTHWNQTPTEDSLFIPNYDRHVLVWHVMTFQGQRPWPGCEDSKGATLLRRYPQYDLIITGDNHKPFTETYEGRILVNPGCLSRQSASQMDYSPAVWLWYADTNTVIPVYIPINENVVSRGHIEEQQMRDTRIDAFISKLDGEYEAGLSFEDNLEIFFAQNQIRNSVKQIIYKSMEV